MDTEDENVWLKQEPADFSRKQPPAQAGLMWGLVGNRLYVKQSCLKVWSLSSHGCVMGSSVWSRSITGTHALSLITFV